MKYNNFLKLLAWIVLFEVIGFLLGKITTPNIDFWYKNLHKSTLTPPGYVFGIVWSILYAILAIIAWIFTNNQLSFSKKSIILFASQMLMNWTWTPIFFRCHWLKTGLAWLMGIIILNILLYKEISKLQKLEYTSKDSKSKFQQKYKFTQILLAPYIFWLLFASYLNLIIIINL